jgi:hypothetical protein
VVRNYRGTPARAEIMLLPDSVDVERAKLLRVSPRDVPFAFADTAGQFRLPRVAAGSYVVRVREIGMQTITSRVVVSEWGVELTVVLARDVSHRSTCGLVRPPAT